MARPRSTYEPSAGVSNGQQQQDDFISVERVDNGLVMRVVYPALTPCLWFAYKT